MAIRKYFIYITIIAVLLIACYYHESINDSIGQRVKKAKKSSPFTDYRIEGDIKDAMGR